VETKKLNKNLRRLAGAVFAVGIGAIPAFAGVIYDDIADGDYNGGPEVTSYASAANGATSFGSVISPDNTGAFNNALLMMSNYATASQYSAPPNSGYNVDMNLSLYQVTGAGTGSTPDTLYSPGDLALMSSVTQSFVINYRPEAANDAIPGGCGGGNSDAYLVTDNVYSCGQLNELDFSVNGLLNFGTSYLWVATILNTSDPAAQSLNWAINNLTSNITPSSNPQYDTNYVNGVGGTDWGSIGQGEIAFEAAAPEPASMGLIGLGLLGVGIAVRRKSSKS